jgi:hypothetical protein
MDNKSICAILDAQGFIKNKEFLPREISVTANNGLSMCYEIDPNIQVSELSAQDQKTNMHISWTITGLSYKPTSNYYYNITEVGQLLTNIYNLFKKQPGDVFGIKNNQLKKLLIEHNIPCVQLKSPHIERLNELYGPPWQCRYHTLGRKGRCALCKTIYLNKWLNKNKVI